ncbi:MAG TPA: DUF5996 family protein [Vicinamibacterales bacterium]|nr:DUF5996 family protein [Vicinamibacterales bacterium]
MSDRHSPLTRAEIWPDLPFASWRDTYATLHMWTQIVGKIRMAQSPMINHWWQVPLYVTARGLTTSPMPCGPRTFQIDFDFIEHVLVIETSDGRKQQLPLRPMSVADFYQSLVAALHDAGIDVRIWTTPVEVESTVPFDRDREHASYDPDAVNRFWRVLVQAERVFTAFRARFIGKVSPVHFFWGSFDLAVTRFSGRAAPPHPGGGLHVADWVTREAYSHEVSSLGFWPGSDACGPVFYSYAYPEPAGYKTARVEPEGASYNAAMGEFLLPYERVARAEDPDETLLAFAQTTYEAAADLAGWDRAALERREDLTPASKGRAR